jgi:FHS family glucose/mannose:H+ symporter-like MFS transporter
MPLSPSARPTKPSNSTRPKVIYTGFVLTGMVTTLLGPILPALAARWSLTDAQSGSLFTAQFVGSTLGVLLSAAIFPKLGLAASLPAGYALMSLGVSALSTSAWPSGLVSVFAYGLGLGIVIPASNLLIAEANPSHRAAELNILNLAWGLGAVGCPPVVAVLLARTGGTAGVLRALALPLAIVATALLFQRPTNLGLTAVGRAVWPDSILHGRFLAVLATIFFLYVGTENSLAGWITSYARRLSIPPGRLWVFMPSFFWASLLAGRAVAPGILRRVKEGKLLVTGLAVAWVGVAALLAGNGVTAIGLGVSLAGLGLASVFPIAIAMLSEHGGSLALRTTGVAFALAGLGGATLPWLVGVLSTRFGGLKAGLSVPLAAIAVLMVLQPYASLPKSAMDPSKTGPPGA